jgi:sensor histidine kinase YesM
MSLSERILDFNSRHRVISHLIFWIVLLSLQLSSSSYFNADQVPISNNLLGDCTNLLAQIPAAYFLAYFVVPRFIYTEKYLSAIFCFLLSSYLICVLSRLSVVHIEEPWYGTKRNPEETLTEIFTDIPKLIYVYFFRIFSVAFIFMLFKLLKDQLLIQKRSLSLEKEKAETELKLLKIQLNPHFLFNTLNNIYSLSLCSSPVTSTAIGRLSEILDYLLYRCDSPYVPVSGEIRLLQNYIGLENLRYDERLKVNFNCQVNEPVQIAPMILLSILENAFKHGAGNDTGEPIIRIDLNASPNLLAYKVVNTFQAKDISNGGNIGLINLTRQLALLYPQKHTLLITQTENLFTVDLKLNLA